MTTDQFRKNLSDWIKNYRLSQSIGNDNNFIDIDFLRKSLNDTKFSSEASVEDLYKFRAEVIKLHANTESIVKQIDEMDILFWGQFEDQIMEFEELDIGTRHFECVKQFSDDFSHLNILPGTAFEVEEYLYPNAGNMIAGVYRKLVTDSQSKKLIELFNNGQKVILNLKILGDYFKPKEG